MSPVPGQLYADGQRDDGRLLPFPTSDESIIFQRQLIRDMHKIGGGTYACLDPNTKQPLTRAELFDNHALVMLVIQEVESRAAQHPAG